MAPPVILMTYVTDPIPINTGRHFDKTEKENLNCDEIEMGHDEISCG